MWTDGEDEEDQRNHGCFLEKVNYAVTADRGEWKKKRRCADPK